MSEVSLLVVHTLYSFALECIQILMATVVWINVDQTGRGSPKDHNTIINELY